MRIYRIPTLFALLTLNHLLLANTLTVDLSRSHALDDLTRSGISMNKIAGGLKGQSYSFHNQHVLLILPANRSFELQVNRGLIDTDDEYVIRISMTGSVVPTDQALLIAELFHATFNLPTTELDSWYERNRNVDYATDRFSISPLINYYPATTLTISPSMNPKYPWVTRFILRWDWRPHTGWDEERAWREFSTSPNGLTHISLDPPSGRTYDRGDTFRDLAVDAESMHNVVERTTNDDAQAEFNLITPSPPIASRPPDGVTTVDNGYTHRGEGWQWPILALGVIAVIILASLLVVRMKSK